MSDTPWPVVRHAWPDASAPVEPSDSPVSFCPSVNLTSATATALTVSSGGREDLRQLIQARDHTARRHPQFICLSVRAIHPYHVKTIGFRTHHIKGIRRDEDDRLLRQPECLR